jgi:F0F1-type ATP synthase membrane subunit b/b'
VSVAAGGRAIVRWLFVAGCALLLLPAAASAASEGGTMDLVWRIVNLLILFAILYAVARKPIQAFFADRRDGIQGDVQEAAKLHKEAEERYAKWQRQLADLAAELAEIRRVSSQRAAA